MKHLLISAFLWIALPSGAATVTDIHVLPYHDAALSTLHRLKEQGISTVGGQSIDRLLRDFDSLSFSSALFFNKPDGSLRWTAFNSPNYVIVNQRAPFFPEGLELIALHETLGALGVPDNLYEISVSTMILLERGERLSRARQAEILRTIAKAGEVPSGRDSFLTLAGGVNFVGGGGDAIAAGIKRRILETFVEKECVPWKWLAGLRVNTYEAGAETSLPPRFMPTRTRPPEFNARVLLFHPQDPPTFEPVALPILPAVIFPIAEDVVRNVFLKNPADCAIPEERF